MSSGRRELDRVRGTRTASAIVLAVALALAGEAAAAPRSPRATAARPVVARSAAATSSMAACARALSRTNGPVWRRTPDGDLEQELPAACGGNYERRSRTGDPCRDGCFIADGTRELAVAARFREGNLLLVLVTSGRRFTPATWLRLPEGEIQLLDAGAADRVRRALGAVHGAAATQPRLGAGERVSFYVLGWRQDREGWHGELSAAVRVGVGLKLVPVAQASPREGGPPLRAASPSPPPRGVTRPTR